jgi:uncharacterized membrane protein
MIIGAVVRHFYNSRHKGLPSPWWTWAVSAACGLAIVWLSTFPSEQSKRAASAATFAEAEAVVTTRCSMCHAATPVWEGIGSAPKGVMLDNPARIRAQRVQIALHSVASTAMPPGNITEMTSEERDILRAWVRSDQ